MDDTLGSSLVQSANGIEHFRLGLFGIFSANGRLSLAQESAGGSAVDAIAQAGSLILLVSFDLRLNISQLLPPKIIPIDLQKTILQ